MVASVYLEGACVVEGRRRLPRNVRAVSWAAKNIIARKCHRRYGGAGMACEHARQAAASRCTAPFLYTTLPRCAARTLRTCLRLAYGATRRALCALFRAACTAQATSRAPLA